MVQARDGPIRARVLGTYNQGTPDEYTATEPRGHDSTWPKGFGTVTFTPNAWNEEDSPEKNAIVILEDLFMTAKGWRARNVRYVHPSDE